MMSIHNSLQNCRNELDILSQQIQKELNNSLDPASGGYIGLHFNTLNLFCEKLNKFDDKFHFTPKDDKTHHWNIYGITI